MFSRGEVVLIRGVYESPVGTSSDVSAADGGLRVLRSLELLFKSRRLPGPGRPVRLRRSTEAP